MPNPGVPVVHVPITIRNPEVIPDKVVASFTAVTTYQDQASYNTISVHLNLVFGRVKIEYEKKPSRRDLETIYYWIADHLNLLLHSGFSLPLPGTLSVQPSYLSGYHTEFTFNVFPFRAGQTKNDTTGSTGSNPDQNSDQNSTKER